MQHLVKKKRLGRDFSHMNAMLRNMATSVILHERVKTTQAKAKLVKPIVEHFITMAKNTKGLPTLRQLNSYLKDENATAKLMQEIAKRYESRTSGFLRIIPVGFRAGDAATMVQLELV